MKIKDTAGLIKYVSQYKAVMFFPIIFLLNSFMYIFAPFGVLLQGIMVSLSSVYFVNSVMQVYASDMIRSSEKVNKAYIKNHTIMLLISNIFHFAAFMVPTFLHIRLSNETPNSVILVLLTNYIISNVGLFAFIAIMYKKEVLATFILTLVLIAFGVQVPLVYMNMRNNHWKLGEIGLEINQTVPDWVYNTLLLLAFVVCIASPFIFFGISKLMRKIPMRKSYTDRLPWGK
jgi:hypothetical protein